MALRIDLTFDTRDAESLAGFWKLALGYEDEPPPARRAAACCRRSTATTWSWPPRRVTSSASRP